MTPAFPPEPNSVAKAGTVGGRDAAGVSLPLGPGRSYLDPIAVGRLIGEVAQYESAGVFPPRTAHPFDRRLAEMFISERSSRGAERAVAAARTRGAIPAVPAEPETAVELAVDCGVLKVRGAYHYETGAPCQDGYAHRIDRASGTFCGVIADGVSAVKLAHHTAAIMSAAVAAIAEELVTDRSGAFRENGSFMNARFLRELHLRTARAYLDLCDETGYHPADAAERFLASTLQVVIITPRESAMFGLSDGVFRWGGTPEEVVTATGRCDPGCNTPPLIERLILDECELQRLGARDLFRGLDGIDRALIREAESFHVIRYGPTSVVFPEVIEMATDGAHYTDMLPHRAGEHFPLVRLAVEEGRSFDEIGAAVEVSHLVRFGMEIAVCEGFARAIKAARESAEDPAVDEADILIRTLERIDGGARAEIIPVVRDFLRTMPHGRALTLRVSRDAPLEVVKRSILLLRDSIELESIDHFLEERRQHFVEAAVGVLIDLCSRDGANETATTFRTRFREALLPLRDEALLVSGCTVGDLISTCSEEQLVRLLGERTAAFLGARRCVVGKAIDISPKLLEELFNCDARRWVVGVEDDLTWLVAGPRQEQCPERGIV